MKSKAWISPSTVRRDTIWRHKLPEEGSGLDRLSTSEAKRAEYFNPLTIKKEEVL